MKSLKKEDAVRYINSMKSDDEVFFILSEKEYQTLSSHKQRVHTLQIKLHEEKQKRKRLFESSKDNIFRKDTRFQ